MREGLEVSNDNICEAEPIHIPGSIQPHGCLIAFEGQQVCCVSENVRAYLGVEVNIGDSRTTLASSSALGEELDEDMREAIELPLHFVKRPVSVGTGNYTRSIHHHDGRTIAEFEPLVAFDTTSTRKSLSLRGIQDVQQVLQRCVDQIRSWTGFDRVLAYAFESDASGEVVAESRVEDVGSMLHLRFPASDIPRQARDLYTISTLRAVFDVDYLPVSVACQPQARPLDQSFGSLRALSPAHLEYLRCMGVRSSMSVSILLEGRQSRLWGLIACHHRTPHYVPHVIRDACDRLAQLVGSRVQASQGEEREDRIAKATTLLRDIVRTASAADDMAAAFAPFLPDLMALFKSDAIVVAHRGQLVATPGIAPETARLIVDNTAPGEIKAIRSLDEWPTTLRHQIGDWVGVLALTFDPMDNGHLLALRREQVSHVRWAGDPSNRPVDGRCDGHDGSRTKFDEWRETVRGKCAAWTDTTTSLAHMFQAELSRLSLMRHAELQLARQQMIAMLGHDLRDPLQSIHAAGALLQQQDERGRQWGGRIVRSSSRMQRLIASVLDLSRVQAGQRMVVDHQAFDISDVVKELIDESRLAYPNTSFECKLPQPVPFVGDRVRISQALSNLLSNACRHTDAGHPIRVELSFDQGLAHVSIANRAEPVDRRVIDRLHEPFKQNRSSDANRTGLGLGLFLAHRIADESGGRLSYEYADAHVTFHITLASAPALRRPGSH